MKEKVGLHIFCDSSQLAYGFVAYAYNCENDSHMIFSKSKVAPVSNKRSFSIPTLEFMSLVIS